MISALKILAVAALW